MKIVDTIDNSVAKLREIHQAFFKYFQREFIIQSNYYFQTKGQSLNKELIYS